METGNDVVAKRSGSTVREKPKQIADELRALIVKGELVEGQWLGREPELVERFGMPRRAHMVAVAR